MTRTSSRSGKGWRRPAAQLRTLDDHQLAGVAGGVIGIIDEYKPSESLRPSGGDQAIIFWYPDSGGTVSGGGPHV